MARTTTASRIHGPDSRAGERDARLRVERERGQRALRAAADTLRRA